MKKESDGGGEGLAWVLEVAVEHFFTPVKNEREERKSELKERKKMNK